MEYIVIRQVHVACAALSYFGFFLRGVWMMRDSPMLGRRWVRILPHVVDTILLASAIALSVMSLQYPFVQGWLTAKVVALVLYIGLGMLALKPGRARPQRIAAWVAAQLVFGYIVWVALARDPFPVRW